MKISFIYFVCSKNLDFFCDCFCSTLEINFIFSRYHVIFSIFYWEQLLYDSNLELTEIFCFSCQHGSFTCVACVFSDEKQLKLILSDESYFKLHIIIYYRYQYYRCYRYYHYHYNYYFDYYYNYHYHCNYMIITTIITITITIAITIAFSITIILLLSTVYCRHFFPICVE